MEKEFREKLVESFNSGLSDIFSYYSNKISVLEDKVQKQDELIKDLSHKHETLQKDYDELKEDFESYKSVSVVKNLHDQIFDKDNIIKNMTQKIEKLSHKLEEENSVVKNNEESFESETMKSESLEEVEVSFIEKKLRGKIYYVSEDNDRDIYEKLLDGEIGEHVGKYNDNNRPIFFKKR
jgi:predicted RNase H-like nuclease (RuvC/YqgF family)